ncbi:MAG: DNA polymerase III subunit gamma/tau [Clostridia bacterium]|nr:DNA polymerase III subunit gamma/tau [Clostridia bacterium]
MYQALYRKWRPRTFSDVCGQDTVTTALKNELKNDRLSHAYLFTGCRGTGKTTCAKILAKAVNCQHPVEGDPCNTCEVCRGIDDGSILDVTEIDAASNNGVDNIRELRDEVAFTPAVGKYRVYIIDEVHMLSAGAFNALLKTLEEPPAHVIFILATTEVHKLPATILSRCQRFDFNRIRPEDIASRLSYVAGQEGLTLTEEAALLLARLADGALRDGLSLLDQCASVSDRIDAATVAAVTGMAGQQALADLTACVGRQDAAGALALVDTLYQSAKDMERLCAEWLMYMRNLMVLCSVKNAASLLVVTPQELEEMKGVAQQLGLPAILHIMEVLQSALERLRSGISPRVEMEMAVLRLCDPQLDNGTAALLKRIAALENALRSGNIPAAAPAPQAAEPTPAPAEEPPLPTVEPDTPPAAPATEPAPAEEIPFTAWGDVLENLRNTCMPLYGVLADSQAVLKGDMLFICTENAMFKTLLANDGNKTQLRAAIQAAAGTTYRLGLRSTKVVQKKAADPLSQLMEAGRQAGIPVHEND